MRLLALAGELLLEMAGGAEVERAVDAHDAQLRAFLVTGRYVDELAPGRGRIRTRATTAGREVRRR